MQPLQYTRVQTAAEAVQAFSGASGQARYIAGGTTLYDLMKLGVERPTHLIDIADLEGSTRIETQGDRLFFGAGARMADVAEHEVVRRDYPVLAQSLSKAASQQLRNMASVGGNLMQRTRCLYFRNGAGGIYPCNKREPGSGCAAIGGLDRGQAVLGTSSSCTAVSPGDWPVALTALDAVVEVLGPSGIRMVPIVDFYRLPEATPHIEFNLTPGEVVTGISVPKTKAGRRSTYHKIRDRESFAFALASAAVALSMDGDRIERAHIAIGGMVTRPWRALETEAQLEGQRLTYDHAIAAARAAFATARAGSQNGFKIELGARTLADAIMIAAGRSA
ncbi:FAD-binding molybdopterin dehydrogenase [Sphingobium sp. SCG-1]|uniref:FAD binding domain-containing protein n=1 Tax=Sphingobium sp. SCG-1 TaxID=2072936 RepID=UPI000CD6C211|nr:xanthine dehydrogenase family protein subunit M [Sphingobium sp. SCG-1]AUW56979.1 FAD-binding molybdopterin dehydrogenase [Sphingobium sp. SCG-1]